MRRKTSGDKHSGDDSETWPRESLQCLKEHASLEVQRAIDVQPVRFAASTCVPIKGKPRNIRSGKKMPDEVIPVVTLIKNRYVTRSGSVKLLV